MSQMGEIALTITGRDIWEKLDRIETEISGLPRIVADHENRLRKAEAQLHETTASQDVAADHELRIRMVQATLSDIASAGLPSRVSKLETKMWLATGFVLASGGTGALLAKYIGA